jgi:hypothetical protein
MPKRTGGVAQAVQHLQSKHEALSSNPSTTKKKKANTQVKMVKGYIQIFFQRHINDQ